MAMIFILIRRLITIQVFILTLPTSIARIILALTKFFSLTYFWSIRLISIFRSMVILSTMRRNIRRNISCFLSNKFVLIL
jgi:hypothetical protein